MNRIIQIPSVSKFIGLLSGLIITSPVVDKISGCPVTGTGHPNVVMVVVDDLRWDELGYMGHPFAKTINIDKIACKGVRFRNAFVTTPLCSPSRASILTGQYAHNHGIIDNTDRSDQSHRLVTFPWLLHDSGYETAFIGKWHMGNDDTARPGFDHWISLKGQGTSFDPEINENGIRKQYTGYTTDILNEKAVNFIRKKHEKPFCLYLAHKALHPETVQFDDGTISDPSASKFMPAERHNDWYKNDPIPRRLNYYDDLSGKPALQRKIDDLPPLGPETGSSDETIRGRQRMLVAVDEGIGDIMTAIEETGHLENTVFIFTSDEGYWYGEHGLSVERRLAYEESARIPLLIQYPKIIKPGGVIDEMVLGTDLAPTVIELAGIDSRPEMDGCSLVPLLKGIKPDSWRTSFLIEYYSDIVFPRVRNMGYKAVRTQRFKYIHYTDLEGMDEMYDLKSDPYELKNIINDHSSREKLSELKTELQKYTVSIK
ncbi:MAG: sulfatase [Bacteroidales bacterium]|nr:sulfatase [Bacteroidales bacterium]